MIILSNFVTLKLLRFTRLLIDKKKIKKGLPFKLGTMTALQSLTYKSLLSKNFF